MDHDLDFLNNMNDSETEEQCKARLQKIREDAKARHKHYSKPTTLNQDMDDMDSAASLIYGHSMSGRLTGLLPEPLPYTRHAKHDMEFDTKVRQMSELMSMDWSSLERHLGFDPYKRGMSKATYYVMDECHHIDPAMYWTSKYKSEPKEKDWERKTFKSGGPTTPSEAVRLKRRAERKAKRKK